MRFLIDGYNLLHAIGWAAKPSSGMSWERSRLRMLDWLAGIHGTNCKDVWIIFDAYLSARGETQQTHRQINICYPKSGTADDRIEELIATETRPVELAVVSNDGRIQNAARRRKCQAWTCDRYLDWSIDRGQLPPSEPIEEPEKRESADPKEIEEWLRIFGEPRR